MHLDLSKKETLIFMNPFRKMNQSVVPLLVRQIFIMYVVFESTYLGEYYISNVQGKKFVSWANYLLMAIL